MRSLIATLLLLGMISTAALAQQSNEPKKEKKPKEPDATKAQQMQPPTKPPEMPAAAPDETKSDTGKTDKDDKDEHYDMKEVPPVVTHHQITLNSKALNYTATTGRLPIKRGDGKIEAEMFFVAYNSMARRPRSVP